MSIVSILFEQKRWLPEDILYIVTGNHNSSGVAWVYRYDTAREELSRDFGTLDYRTLLEVGTERRYQKDARGNYQYFRKILKCPDSPNVVGDWVAESDITKVSDYINS